MKVLLDIGWRYGTLRRPYRNHEMCVDITDLFNGHSVECSHEADGLTFRAVVSAYQARSCFGRFGELFYLSGMGQ